MFTRLLTVILLFSGAILATAAGAQDTAVPESRQQVQLSFAPVVKKVSPAVVNIYTKRVVARQVQNPFMKDPMFAQLFGGQMGGRMRRQVESTLGSGLLVDPDGLVVTNAHVIRDADEITVVLSDGREFDGKVVLKDDPSDITLVRIDTKGEKLPYATLEPSESLEVGDLVLAIGNPFGIGQTVTSGIVSAQARSSLNVNDFNFFIQTDAAINPGNSGGPLVALDGGVVGINSSIYSKDGGSLGIGFAIPSEMVATVIAAEKAGQGAKGVARPWLGLFAQNITSEIAASLGMSHPAGILVTALHSASPLAAAGIKAGDVILAINGHELRDAAEAKFRMATVLIGQKAKFEILRKGQKLNFDVAAVSPPDVPPRQETPVAGDNPFNGATIANINPALSVQLGLNGEDKGVVITEIKNATYASRLFSAGDIIAEINGKEINNVKDAGAALAQDVSSWSLAIKRQGHMTRVVIR